MPPGLAESVRADTEVDRRAAPGYPQARMSAPQVRDIKDVLQTSDPGSLKLLTEDSACWVVSSEDCLSYIAANHKTREVLVVDPKQGDEAAYEAPLKKLVGYRVVAVLDTHTHADHLSSAAHWAARLQAPLVMHEAAPSQRVDLRVARATQLPTAAGPLHFLITPGHTPDSLTALWGPFLFGGDALLFGDCGRDDLPGGDAEAHFESLQTIKAFMEGRDAIVLPGHDHKGGRASSFAHQLTMNPALKQSREEFVPEAQAFSAPAPALLKDSLRENFK